MLSKRYPRSSLDGHVDQTIRLYNGHEVVDYTITRLEFFDAIMREEREGVQSPPNARQFMNRWLRGPYNIFDGNSAAFMQLSEVLGEFPNILENAYAQAIKPARKKRSQKNEFINDICEAGNIGYEFACAELLKPGRAPVQDVPSFSLDMLTSQQKTNALNAHVPTIASFSTMQTMYINYIFGALHHLVVNKEYSYDKLGIIME